MSSLVRLFGAFAASIVVSVSMLGMVKTVNGQTGRSTASPPSDVKIRQRMTTGEGGQAVETVMYVKGSRMRNETASTGMSMSTVRQCDLRRTIMINDKARKYFIMPDASGPDGGDGGMTPAAARVNIPRTETRRGGVVTFINTMTDTGERKQMFGFTARRIKTSTVKEASPDACDKGDHKIETDGWYIDFQFEFYCPTDRKKPETPGLRSRPDCDDEIRMKSIGKAKLGFPVLTTTTIYGADGQVTSTVINEVMELSMAPLAPELFDVPAGYTLARNYQELYGMSTGDGGSGVRSDRADTSTQTGTAQLGMTSTANTLPGFVAASSTKREGVSRIGIVMPKAQMSSADPVQAAAALRSIFAAYLNSPSIELVALNARLPSQALEEARQSNCDYVLYASITQKKGGGGMFARALGNIAGSAIGHVPSGGTAGGVAARSAAITGVHTAADISGSIKSKDELTLEYKLESTDAAKPGLASTAKAKAKSDGEDVLTPMVEKAAQAVVDVVTPKSS